MKFFRFILAAFLPLAISVDAWASLLYLKNGDRITGEVIGKDSGSYAFKTPMGVLNIPSDSVVRIVDGDVPQVSAASGDGAAEQVVAASDAAEAKPASTEAVADNVPPDPYADLPSWMREYKYFLQDTIPEGWKFKIRGGIEYKKSNSELMSYSFSFSGNKDWGGDMNHFDFNLYYDYTQETVSNIKSNTTDKYGLDTTYRRDLTQSIESPFGNAGTYKIYLENLLDYKKDMVKGIRHEVDEGMTFGASFEFPDSGIKFSMGPGPAVRYVCANGYDSHWVVMGVVSENFSWDFNRIMRLEQSLYFGQNATNFSQHTLDFMLGLVVHATDIMDIALRYSYEYDTINSSDAITTEERLILSFEFPLY